MHKLLMSIFLAACVAAEPMLGSLHPLEGFDCSTTDNHIYSCFLVKTYVALDKAARSGDIKIIDGVTFIREAPMERTARILQKSEHEILSELPQDDNERVIKLGKMLYTSIISFLKSHSLKLTMHDVPISRALEEGRLKLKKTLIPLIAGIKAVTVLPIVGFISVMAMKAFMTAKIALLAIGSMLLYKLFYNNNMVKSPQYGYYDNGSAGWSNGSPIQGTYRRSLPQEADAQKLAYSAYVPTTVSN
ncbi:PREDICTED: uncharacterized protein LOC106744948 [Dinoponera quadriceps]|uniref:Uncharacterized protein LOC106744948 n=1 Tax=Dinoponera quadriceps TaxID=609295 RepID=A0A6P3XBG8_DINQU|nr:PREDICTED: uncharacterized protein LOC106744948 [Dinoponera quadriceps]